MDRSSRRGVVLVLVASLLSLLAMICVVMTHMMASGRGMARARIDDSRAGLLARSGVEMALARLSGSTAFPSVRTASNQRGDWRYRDDPAVPVGRAHNPSYAAGEPYEDVTADGRYESSAASADGFTPSVHDRDGDGRHTGFSGRLRGALASYGDTFALRIDDESAKINVNGGFVDRGNRDADLGDPTPDHRDVAVGPEPATAAATGRGWNGQLRRILDILGMVREDADGDGTLDAGEDWDGDGVLDPAPIGVADLGRIVIEGRPAGGYTDIRVVEDVVAAASGIRPDLTPYLTVSSWVDTKVVRPNVHEVQTVTVYQDVSEWMLARPPLRVEEGGRPPVNLNGANRAVLQSVLTGLRGLCGYSIEYPRNYTISAAIASGAADRIVAQRPFSTWRQFSDFCDSLAPSVISGMNVSGGPVPPGNGDYQTHGAGNLAGCDILKANFDPNTRLNKTLPDQVLYRWVDKTDLLVWSTEGSLGPTGTFGIESLGRVRDVRGDPVAASTVRR
ncbi:MAG: hypothetical protein HY608_10020 [Planctomycetes bacterium]|nr:hypothetical protein [Planctomycetota bacterium]